MDGITTDLSGRSGHALNAGSGSEYKAVVGQRVPTGQDVTDEVKVVRIERNRVRGHIGDDVVYGGYSAGVCIIGLTLRGVELVDDPTIVPDGYQKEIVWDGVGLVDFSFAPHYQSDHAESSAVDKMVDFYKKNAMPFRALKDGEVIIQTI